MSGTTNRVDLELSGEEYDRLSDEAGAPRYLFLCTTPRTGSHRLSRAMYELGLAFPGEYLHPWAFERMGKRWCPEADPATPEGFEVYWSNVCRWRGRDGIVACAAFGYQIAQVRQIVGTGEGHLFIHLHRRTRSDQVASLMTLYQTKMPYEGHAQISGIPDISEISPRSIRIVNQFLDLQERRWQAFLRDKPHLAVASEDFFADPAGVLERIAIHCGRDPAALPIAEAAGMAAATRAYTVNRDTKNELMAQFPEAFAGLDKARGRGV